MREFKNIGEMIAHIAVMDAAVTLELRHSLKKCAVDIETNAKSEIGEYQPRVGSFAAWEPLADSTEAEKARLGFPLDAPLERTGELRDSISYQVEGLEAVIGSDSDIMVYQELGTEHIPPRAVMGPAAIHSHKFIEKTLGKAVAEGILYGSGVSLARLE